MAVGRYLIILNFLTNMPNGMLLCSIVLYLNILMRLHEVTNILLYNMRPLPYGFVYKTKNYNKNDPS